MCKESNRLWNRKRRCGPNLKSLWRMLLWASSRKLTAKRQLRVSWELPPPKPNKMNNKCLHLINEYKPIKIHPQLPSLAGGPEGGERLRDSLTSPNCQNVLLFKTNPKKVSMWQYTKTVQKFGNSLQAQNGIPSNLLWLWPLNCKLLYAKRLLASNP